MLLLLPSEVIFDELRFILLAFEEDVEIIDANYNGNGSDSDFDGMIDDQILEEFHDELYQISEAHHTESEFDVGLVSRKYI